MHHPNRPCMHNSINPLTGEQQSFYFSDNHPHYPGWFKGMEQIIHEHGLWPDTSLSIECSLWPDTGLSIKCTGPKHSLGPASCCYHHLLYSQPNFTLQKPLLQEYIKSCGHLCDYYPKYHCELNFIEQYWGAVKLWFHIAGHAKTLREMERKMLRCLDDIPLEQI